MTFHHGFGIFTCYWVLAVDEHGWDSCLIMTLQEMTNFPMHGRFIAKFHESASVLTFFEISFVVVFFFIRMVVVNYMWYFYLYGRSNWYMAKLGYPAMQAMNLIFWGQIWKVLNKNYIKPLFSKKKTN